MCCVVVVVVVVVVSCSSITYVVLRLRRGEKRNFFVTYTLCYSTSNN